MLQSWKRFAVVLSFSVVAAACGTTRVHPQHESVHAGLPRPNRILVHDLATSEADVTPNKGMTSHSSAKHQRSTIAREAVNAFGDDLVEQLRKLGFNAVRAERGAPVGVDDLVIDGAFVVITEGSRLKRIVIGFGSGKSVIDTQVHVSQGPERRHLLDFTTHSDSGSLPGAAVTLPVGAAVTGGVGVGAVATTSAVAGIKAHRSKTAQMAGRSGEQAADYLSQYFAKQGWISEDQVKRAKVD
jgi:hypothetical protein